MDDFLEQTAVRRRRGAYTALYYLVWGALILSGLVALFSLTNVIGADPEAGGLVLRWPFLLMALAFGGATYLLYRVKDECRIEYDYAFTNGSLDVSRVLNERRRRYLCALETREVLSCGPARGPAFQRALRQPGVKIHNWFLNREAPLTFFYFQKKGLKHVIVLELNEEMISIIRSKKYLQTGAWDEGDL